MSGYLSEEQLAELNFGKLGKNVRISVTSMIYNCQNIEIGDNVRIDNFCTIAPSGGARLRIGDYVHISAYNFMNGMKDITLGDFSTTAPFVAIFSSTDDYSGQSLTGGVVPRALIGTFSGEVRIGKHVIIGTNSTIMPGITLAEGTAVGAHSFVKTGTDAFDIVAGVPARKIGQRDRRLLTLEKQINE
jgi:acetyltransferase-like isoleucine patch superfamily enzyme